jgi:hypothetical protein
MGLRGPSSSLVDVLASASFRVSSPPQEMVSSRPSFVSSSIGGRNIGGVPSRRFDPETGSLADLK